MTQLTNPLAAMLADVTKFQDVVLGVEAPGQPTMLPRKEVAASCDALREEVEEFFHAKTIEDQGDALADLIFFALGRMVRMGLTPQHVFAAVAKPNLKKVRGSLSKRPGWVGHDAVKPEGWVGPDHSWMAEMTEADVENLRLRAHRRAAATIAGALGGQATDGAMKFNAGKPPLTLIPQEFLDAVAQAFAYGRVKYSAWNWTQGRAHSEYADAAARHIWAHSSGEDLDPESGVSHIGHAGASLAMLAGCVRLHPGMDDRRPR